MITEPTSDIVTTPGTPQPLWAIQPTTEAVVTPWYEVFAENDPRGGPTRVGIAAVNEFDVMGSSLPVIEIKGPDDTAYKCDGFFMLLELGVPLLFRLNKPQTLAPMGYLLFGYSAAVSESS